MDGIADYRFLSTLSEGGHGSFHLAVTPERLGLSAPQVAVKVLRGADNPDGLRRATRELRAFAAARSPYLVTLLDAGRDGDNFFYAMEFSEQGSLASVAGALDRVAALRFVADAARGAFDLHQVGMVHRGIKPENILLHGNGARLADLGLVQAFDRSATVTGLGAMTSVEYVDPGLLSGGAATPESDIYSLGATLHRALSGEGIFGDLPANDPLLCVRTVLTRTPTMSQRITDADAGLISQCLGPLADRPSDARALADLLDPARGG